MDNNIRRASCALLVAFLVVALRLGFVVVARGRYLAGHPRNPRVAAARRSIVRGGVYLRSGEVVARDGAAGGPRLYTGPVSLAHLVGYEDPRYGMAGLESTYNASLLGFDENPSVAGSMRRFLAGETGGRGNDLVLTVDLEIQQAAERGMGGRRGAAVVLDPRTGAVLAMLSNPGFTPRQISSDWHRLAGDGSGPLFNRAAQGLYPPGSTIKPVAAAIALSTGVIAPQDVIPCAGSIKVGTRADDPRQISCPSGTPHGDVNLARAIARSCNVAFAQIGWQVGAQKLYNGFRRFGFGGSLPFDVPAIPGRVPGGGALDRAAVAQVAIGQGELVVTPLHMAVMMGALANGGSMRRPYVVGEVRSPSGVAVYQVQESTMGVPVSATVARLVKDMMVEAVAGGTARGAGIPGVEVAGKTGTAENPHGAPHAWFVGFAPADKPSVLVVVVVENGGSGGKVAAPIAREIMRSALGNSAQ